MVNYTRKKKYLRGGAVSRLDPNELGIHNGTELKEKMELYTIGAHGETTDDNYFLVVPDNTYFMFTAHSGTPAQGNDPGEAPYVSYKNNKDQYYEQLYTQLFGTYNERKASGLPQYSEKLYIYQPGDLVPDYLLSFNNTIVFMFRHGVYKLPVEALSGKGKVEYTYLGRPLGYMKKQLEEGKLYQGDLKQLPDVNRASIKTKTVKELEGRDGVTSMPKYKKSRIYDKVETLCCRGNDNLLFKKPFDVEQFKRNEHVMRLSTILHLLPSENKPYRFFFMNYCRISYGDVVSGYSKKSLLVPKILRTLSVSGKCSEPNDEKAFNLLKIKNIFCNFPFSIKARMIKHPLIRQLIQILKKGIYVGEDFEFWSDCLADLYLLMANQEQYFELVQNYKGFITLEDINILTKVFHFSLDENKKAFEAMKNAETKKNKLIQDLGKTNNNSNKEQIRKQIEREQKAEIFFSRLKAAYAQLGTSFKTLFSQFQEVSTKLDKEYDEKMELIKEIYNSIADIFDKILVPKKDYVYDYLKLVGNDIEELRSFKEVVETPSIRETLSDIQKDILETREERKKAKQQRAIENNNYYYSNNDTSYDPSFDADSVIESIQQYFIMFVGRQPISKTPESFIIPEIEDDSGTYYFTEISQRNYKKKVLREIEEREKEKEKAKQVPPKISNKPNVPVVEEQSEEALYEQLFGKKKKKKETQKKSNNNSKQNNGAAGGKRNYTKKNRNYK